MRMVRRILLIASTLLLFASVVMWVRSYWWSDSATATRWRVYSVTSYDGTIRFTITEYFWEPPGQSISTPQTGEWTTRFVSTAVDPSLPAGIVLHRYAFSRSFMGFNRSPRRAGFWYSSGTSSRTVGYEESWAVPYWATTLITFILPAAWMVRRFRRSRLRGEEFCLACGYDLRATPDRCPECGQARTAISSGA